jgi:hypothetical protein
MALRRTATQRLTTISPLHPALAGAVHQKAIFFLFLLGELFVFLFVQKAVQGQASHILPIGTAGKVDFTVFMNVGF